MPWHDAQKDTKKNAALASVKAARTVADWRALDGKARDLFRERCTEDQLLGMLRPATSGERAEVLAGVKWGLDAAVRFELAAAPSLVELSSAQSLMTRPVALQSEAQHERRLPGW